MHYRRGTATQVSSSRSGRHQDFPACEQNTAFACAQVDLDMLNVSLGTGTLEIRSALLNTEYLTQQLVGSWRCCVHAVCGRRIRNAPAMPSCCCGHSSLQVMVAKKD